MWFQIKELKLTLFHTDALDKLLVLDTKNFKIDFKKYPYRTGLNLKLESLEIQDYLFEFTNPNLKCLATSVPPLGSEFENADLIEVNVIVMDQEHPNYHEKMINHQIIAQFGYLYANFKPEVVSSTLKFFLPGDKNKQDEDEVQIVPEPERNEISPTKLTEDENSSYIVDLNTTTLDLNISFKEVGLRLVHMRTHVCLAELSVRETSLKIKQKPYFTEFQGSLGNVQLFDTTNYPETIDSNIDYHRIKKYELVGVGEPDKNLLEIGVVDYDPQHPHADNLTNTYTFVKVNLSTVRINYIQKPVLRIIDYIDEQIVPSVKPPKNKETEEQTQKKKKGRNQVEAAEKKLRNPSFLSLKIYAESPIVSLKPQPHSLEYWEFKLGDVIVENNVFKDFKRFKSPKKLLEFVYYEKYIIKLKNMGIFRAQGYDRNPISSEANFELSFEKPTFAREYKILYGDEDQYEISSRKNSEISGFTEVRESIRIDEESKEEDRFFLDETMVLKGGMTPLIAVWQHEDFVLLMKIINYNLAYHDEMDFMFALDYEVKDTNKSQSESMSFYLIFVNFYIAPLRIILTFDNFTLLALEETNLPFCMINLHLLQVEILKDKTGSVNGVIQGYQLNGSYFESHSDKLIERKMIGDLDRINEYPLSAKNKEVIVQEIVTSLIDYSKEIAKTFMSLPEKKRNVQVNVRLDLQSNKKIIKIDIQHLRGFLVLDIYLILAKFLELDQSVHPPKRRRRVQGSSIFIKIIILPKKSMKIIIIKVSKKKHTNENLRKITLELKL